jgi:hypothetical protein
MPSVPFTIPHLYGGLGDCHGLLRADGDSLRLEFQVQDNLMGLVRGRPKTVRILLADLESVEMRNGWFGRFLVLQAKSLHTLADVPGSRQGKVELRVDRKDVPAAEQLVAGVYE